MFREMFFQPTYPNSLSIVEFKLESLLTKYTIWYKKDSEILKEVIQKPHKNKSKPSHLYSIGTDEMKERNLPFSLGYQNVLVLSSPIDIGVFRKAFAKYDFKAMRLEYPPEFSVKPIPNVCGVSILNNSSRIKNSVNIHSSYYSRLLFGISLIISKLLAKAMKKLEICIVVSWLSILNGLI
jgi:hypothetical protein